MYSESGSVMKLVGGMGAATAGAAVLPATGLDNGFGWMLATAAITIGILGIIGQLAVFVIRRYYSTKIK